MHGSRQEHAISDLYLTLAPFCQRFCRDIRASATTREQRDMAFMGYEKDRDSLKYRCPATAYGYACVGRAGCDALAPGNPGGV